MKLKSSMKWAIAAAATITTVTVSVGMIANAYTYTYDTNSGIGYGILGNSNDSYDTSAHFREGYDFEFSEENSVLKQAERFELSVDIKDFYSNKLYRTIPAQATINFGGYGKGGNLYKFVDGKPVFVTCAKLGADGKVFLPGITEKSDYIAMLCEFSNLPGDMSNDGILNAVDASAILKDIVGLESGANPLMADLNGDGNVNAMDASAVLKRIVGLI